MSFPTIANPPFTTAIFDLDGVITDTASLHAKAWKTMFDAFLYDHSAAHDYPYIPFSITEDYIPFVDGKPRYEGVAAFLESRRIVLPQGSPDDPETDETICALGNRKNTLVQHMIREGVDVYPTTIEMIHALQDANIQCAVVSSSKNATTVLQSVGLIDAFVAIIDGNVAAAQAIAGKPQPDTFLACAALLGTTPSQAIVIEDAISGVQAGKAGEFGLVIGVARDNNAEDLAHHGADIVVPDLGILLPNVR